MNFQQVSDKIGRPVHNFQQASDALGEPVHNFQQINDVLDRKKTSVTPVGNTVAAAIAKAKAAAGL